MSLIGTLKNSSEGFNLGIFITNCYYMRIETAIKFGIIEVTRCIINKHDIKRMLIIFHENTLGKFIFAWIQHLGKRTGCIKNVARFIDNYVLQI